MIASFQKEALPLAGLTYVLSGIKHTHESKAGITVPANTNSSFSRRVGVGSFAISMRPRAIFAATGPMYANVNVQDSAKYFAQRLAKLSLNLTKPDIGTARNGVSRQVRAIEENFPSFTTRGGKVLLQSPREGGSLCNSTRPGESKAGATMPDNAISRPVLIPSETSKAEFCESIKKGCDEFSDSIKKGSTADATPLIYEQSAKKHFGHSSDVSGLVLRRSALSFRPQASSTQEEKLDSGFSIFSRSMLASISSNTSWGKRIPLYEDLLFLCPVLTVLFSTRCLNDKKHRTHFITSKVFKHIVLDYDYESDLKCLNTLSTGKAQEVPKIAKPGSASTLTGPLTTTDKQLSRQLCQIVPHPIRGGHHSARTNSPGAFSLSIATTKRPSLAVCPLRLKPNEKPAEFLPLTSSSLWLRVCQYWEGSMLKTYDLPIDPTERTGQLISLAELMRDTLESDSNNREEYLAALISLFEISIRDLHWLLEGNQLPENSDITASIKDGHMTTVQEVNHA